MKILKKKLDTKVGFPPGYSLPEVGSQGEKTQIRYIEYNIDEYKEKEIITLNDLGEIKNNSVTWIDVVGFANNELINNISNKLNIHDMVLEDVFNINHIPKFEEGEDSIVFVLKDFTDDGEEFVANHVVIILKENLVISFRENNSKLLAQKIDRIKKSQGRARRKGTDYLYFVLLDTFIDSYYSNIEKLREKINNLDVEILKNSNENHIHQIYELKNELTSIRKNLFPLKASLNELLSTDSELIYDDNFKYFNDCKDHTNELIEYYHTFEELIHSLIAFNESNLNSNTNRIMKVLTIIATIFIPLTFIAGVYGMNFEFMPELKWRFGYYYSLGLMLFVGLIILGTMKAKKWF